MRDLNLETITDTMSWYKISPLNGYNLIRVKTKNRRKRSRAVTEAESFLYGQVIGIWHILWWIIMESSNINTSSLRNKRNCRTSCTSSKRGGQIPWTDIAICEYKDGSTVFIPTAANTEKDRKNKCMTIWMSTRTEIFQSHGRVSQDFCFWTKLFWKGISLSEMPASGNREYV